MAMPDGSVAHAELTIGNTHLYLSGESPDWHAYAMPEGSKASCIFAINTGSCDDSFKKAVEAGAKPLVEPQDQFWGRRTAVVLDPFGYRWSLSQLVEVVPPDEIMRRAQKLMGG